MARRRSCSAEALPNISKPTSKPSSSLFTFYRPLVPEISPEADQLQHNALTWAQKYDLGAGTNGARPSTR
ncbi:hypothetical protein ACIP6P_23185 [Streptomyces sp. NPDC088729]|uniref:hypothetical protein n=1 Tax=Streptomyces sp. NPDC088729 TaxID=3365876 RepID=UPI003830929E